MKILHFKIILLVSQIFFLISLQPLARAVAVTPTNISPPLKGMALGLYSKDPQYNYLKDLKELKRLGVNSISLMVHWYQKNIHSNQIHRNPDNGKEHATISDKKLIEVIEQAHRLKMKEYRP